MPPCCRRARLAGAGADGARLTVVQQEQMFVELCGGEKGLFSIDCSRSWNGIVCWPGKPGKRLVLLQHISRLPNDMLAYVFPAVPTGWMGDPSLLQILDSRLKDATWLEELGRNGVGSPCETHCPDWGQVLVAF